MPNYFKILITLCLCISLAGCQHKLSTVKSNYAPIKNGKVQYYRFGKGSPIVLIAGYGVDTSSWDVDFLQGLAKQHEVIVFNNRQVGGTVVQSKEYTAQALAEDDYQLLRTLKLNKPTILGYSMGGMIAQQLAVLHPKEIHSLILLNTAIAGYAVHPSNKIEEKMKTMPVTHIARLAKGIDLFFPLKWKLPMAYSLISNRFLPNDYIENDTRPILLEQQRLVLTWINDKKTAEKIKTLSLPTLILNGESDEVIPPVNSVILANSIKGARLVKWKEGGHGMMYQYPKEIASVINEFLA